MTFFLIASRSEMNRCTLPVLCLETQDGLRRYAVVYLLTPAELGLLVRDDLIKARPIFTHIKAVSPFFGLGVLRRLLSL